MLIQPSEFVVIGGAAIGSLLISTPPKVLKMTRRPDQGAVRSGADARQDYVDLLAMLYQIFKQVQQSGVMSLEAHFEDPAQEHDSRRNIRSSWRRHEAVDFLADSVKVIIVGGIAAARPRSADGRGPEGRTTTRR